MTAIFWFRRDLRLEDNPALARASDEGPVLPIFIRDPRIRVSPRRSQALESTLARLDDQIKRDGGPGLLVVSGVPWDVLPELVDVVRPQLLVAGGDCTPYSMSRDSRVTENLRDRLTQFEIVDSPFLRPPGAITTQSGKPFSVFTPYWRAWLDRPVPEVESMQVQWAGISSSQRSRLTPILASPSPSASTRDQVSQSPTDRLRQFVDSGLNSYEQNRDRVDMDETSRLGKALHLGELHPRTVVAATGLADPALPFVRQLAWRDFYADALYHRPWAAWSNVDRRFDSFPWVTGAERVRRLDAWKHGMTGYPMVDAAMRQLAQTGSIHNRSRMIVASFLCKHLLVEWQAGARHFLRELLDADLANNNLGWQWVAGTGLDAAPYFRIFNPVLQGRKFDPNGSFVRCFLPELERLPASLIHEPWRSPDAGELRYPDPIVDHREARSEALAAWNQTKSAAPGG